MPAWWWQLNDTRMADVKYVLAIIGAGLLAWYAAAETHERFRPGKRVRDGLLILLGLLSTAAWWNLGRFHFNPFIHYYEFYHYYLGAKYAPELGYTRLYECTVAAEAEIPGLGRRLERLDIRDLKTNTLTSSHEALAHPEACTEHFTPERWQAFVHDSEFFRRASSWEFWSSALKDNGYNATPVWRIAAGIIANATVIDDKVLYDLGLLDPILLACMAFVIWWAFGWRTLCLALIFFGTNYPGRYWWTGGAFLRMDWLVATVASICLMKKGRPAAAGVAISFATLLRVFPGFILGALILKVGVQSWRAKKIAVTQAQRRFIFGGLAALVLLVPIATWYGGGTGVWRGFVENSKKHVSTPLTNNMGWRTVVAYSRDTRAQIDRNIHDVDPFQKWKHDQLEKFHERRLGWLVGILGFLALLTLAVPRHDDWVALTLGVGLILFSAQLTCYYFIVMLAYALLWPHVRWSGCALLLTSAASCWIPAHWLGWDDERYVVISIVYLVFILGITTLMARFSSAAPEPSPRTIEKGTRSKRRRGARRGSTR